MGFIDDEARDGGGGDEDEIVEEPSDHDLMAEDDYEPEADDAPSQKRARVDPRQQRSRSRSPGPARRLIVNAPDLVRGHVQPDDILKYCAPTDMAAWKIFLCGDGDGGARGGDDEEANVDCGMSFALVRKSIAGLRLSVESNRGINIDTLYANIDRMFDLVGGTWKEAPRNFLEVLLFMNFIFDTDIHTPVTDLMARFQPLYEIAQTLASVTNKLLRIHPDRYDNLHEYAEKTCTIMERLNNLYMLRASFFRAGCAFNPHFTQFCSTFLTANMRAMDFDRLTRHEQTMQIVRELAFCYGVRFRGDNVYEPVIVNGQFVRTFRAKKRRGADGRLNEMTIVEFVNWAAPRCQEHPDARGTISYKDLEAACKHVAAQSHELFPELYMDADYRAFRNGVYNMRTTEFMPFDDLDEDTMCYMYHDCEMDPDAVADLDGPFYPNNKYAETDADLEESEDDWLNALNGTAFREIFEYQYPPTSEGQAALPSTARSMDPRLMFRFFVALLGRLFWLTKDRDHMELALTVIGVAGSGKSTVGTFMQTLYHPQDVASIGGQTETQFGLQGIYNKRLVVMSEAGHDTRRSGVAFDDFLRWVSGELVDVRRKNRDPLSRVWDVPLLLFGNRIMKWPNVEMSLGRRLALFYFRMKVVQKDTELQARLQAELPQFILAATRGYSRLIQHLKSRFGCTDIHRIMPRQMVKNCEDIDVHNDDLRMFLLESNEIFWDKDAPILHDLNQPPTTFVRFDLLKGAFTRWGTKNKRNIASMPTNAEWQIVLAATYPNCDFYPAGSTGNMTVTLTYPRSDHIQTFQPKERTAVYMQNIDLRSNVTPEEAARAQEMSMVDAPAAAAASFVSPGSPRSPARASVSVNPAYMDQDDRQDDAKEEKRDDDFESQQEMLADLMKDVDKAADLVKTIKAAPKGRYNMNDVAKARRLLDKFEAFMPSNEFEQTPLYQGARNKKNVIMEKLKHISNK